MNIVYKNLRQKCKLDRKFCAQYLNSLIEYNKDILIKYFKTLKLGEDCVQKSISNLPLKESFNKKYCALKDSNKNKELLWYDTENNTLIYDLDYFYGTKYKSRLCIMCWIDILEKFNEIIDKEKNIPRFLRSKKIPKFLR